MSSEAWNSRLEPRVVARRRFLREQEGLSPGLSPLTALGRGDFSDSPLTNEVSGFWLEWDDLVSVTFNAAFSSDFDCDVDRVSMFVTSAAVVRSI
jgi:hypothetical protein